MAINIKTIAVLLLIASIFGCYVIYQRIVIPAGIVSKVEIAELVISPDGKEILKGYWLITVVVDRREELIFTVPPEAATASLAEDPTRNIPPGSEILSRKGITMVLRPLGDPYVHGTVKRAGIAYSDAGPEPRTRLWEYYSLATPGWVGVHTPYEVEIRDLETGSLLSMRAFLAGGTDWDIGEKVVLDHGIELLNLGGLWSGIALPSADLAYIFNEGGVGMFVSESTVRDLYLANKPGPRRTEVRIWGAWYDGETEEMTISADRLSWHWGHPGIFGTWANADLKVVEMTDEYVLLSFRHDQGAAFTSITLKTTFEISYTAPGFNPERAYMEVYGGGTATYTLLNGGAVKDGRFTLQIYCPDPVWDAEIKLTFKGAANRWDEFVKQTKIYTLESDPIAEERIIIDRALIPLIPEWVSLWDKTPSLYVGEVPETQYRPDTFPMVDTGEVVVWQMPGTTVYAFVQIKAPVEIFDSVIFRPPYGKPEIVEVRDISIAGGAQATVTVRVRNIGYTEDTFVPSLNLPEGMVVVSYPGTKSIPVTGEASFTWVVAVGDVRYSRVETATVEITAKSSGLKDSESFSVNLQPNPGPIYYTGDLTVHVLDEANRPLEGALVTCAGMSAVTKADGSAIIYNIRVGDQQLVVELEGYETHSEWIRIKEGMNTRTVWLAEVKPPLVPTSVLVALAIGIPAVIGGVYYLRRRGVV